MHFCFVKVTKFPARLLISSPLLWQNHHSFPNKLGRGSHKYLRLWWRNHDTMTRLCLTVRCEGGGLSCNMWIMDKRGANREKGSSPHLRKLNRGEGQCSGSVTFLYGSGSGDPDLWQTDPYPGLFLSDLRDTNTNIFLLVVLPVTFWRYIILQKQKVIKKSRNSRNWGFSYNFGLIMEGSEAVPLTNWFGSGSGRPKNLRILIQSPEHWCRISFFVLTCTIFRGGWFVQNYYLDY